MLSYFCYGIYIRVLWLYGECLVTMQYLDMQGYSSSAQTEYAADGLRWVADYFVKCHHSDVAYTGQVNSVLTCLVYKRLTNSCTSWA